MRLSDLIKDVITAPTAPIDNLIEENLTTVIFKFNDVYYQIQMVNEKTYPCPCSEDECIKECYNYDLINLSKKTYLNSCFYTYEIIEVINCKHTILELEITRDYFELMK